MRCWHWARCSARRQNNAGLGTVINALAILAGGALGILCRSFLQERYQDTIIKATGFSVVFLGAAGTLSKMLNVSPDGSGYEARFSKCGICALMQELGLSDLTSAMCHLDYAMSEAGGVTNFVRKYTLASGGPYCDCGYKKKQM